MIHIMTNMLTRYACFNYHNNTLYDRKYNLKITYRNTLVLNSQIDTLKVSSNHKTRTSVTYI